MPTCAICGEEAKMHSEHEEEEITWGPLPVFQAQPSFNMIEGEEDEEEKDEDEIDKFECLICFGTYSDDEQFPQECMHKFCHQCIISHIQAKIDSGQVSQIRCPWGGCEDAYSE